jgi:hypothetical protein
VGKGARVMTCQRAVLAVVVTVATGERAWGRTIIDGAGVHCTRECGRTNPGGVHAGGASTLSSAGGGGPRSGGFLTGLTRGRSTRWNRDTAVHIKIGRRDPRRGSIGAVDPAGAPLGRLRDRVVVVFVVLIGSASGLGSHAVVAAMAAAPTDVNGRGRRHAAVV